MSKKLQPTLCIYLYADGLSCVKHPTTYLVDDG